MPSTTIGALTTEFTAWLQTEAESRGLGSNPYTRDTAMRYARFIRNYLHEKMHDEEKTLRDAVNEIATTAFIESQVGVHDDQGQRVGALRQFKTFMRARKSSSRGRPEQKDGNNKKKHGRSEQKGGDTKKKGGADNNKRRNAEQKMGRKRDGEKRRKATSTRASSSISSSSSDSSSSEERSTSPASRPQPSSGIPSPAPRSHGGSSSRVKEVTVNLKDDLVMVRSFKKANYPPHWQVGSPQTGQRADCDFCGRRVPVPAGRLLKPVQKSQFASEQFACFECMPERVYTTNSPAAATPRTPYVASPAVVRRSWPSPYMASPPSRTLEGC